MTNNQLYMPWTGSDIYTYTVARELSMRGHSVTVCVNELDPATPLRHMLREARVKLVLAPSQMADPPEVIHAHHNVMATRVRACFPGVPMIFVSHGVIPHLERSPGPDVDVALLVGVSEEVCAGLDGNGAPVMLIRNAVDEDLFEPTAPVRDKPERLLVLSNRMPAAQMAMIRNVCSGLNIKVDRVGGDNQVPQGELPARINAADIVISLGRGIIESMLCGRIPIVYDYQGADGMVTPENVERLAEANFSGRRCGMEWRYENLIRAIGEYDAKNGPELRRAAVRMFGVSGIVDQLERVYCAVTEGERHVDETCVATE